MAHDGDQRGWTKRTLSAQALGKASPFLRTFLSPLLLALREEVNAAAPKDKDGKPAYKLSVNDFVIKALALALQRVPAANAVWGEDCILRFHHSDIAVAVAIDDTDKALIEALQQAGCRVRGDELIDKEKAKSDTEKVLVSADGDAASPVRRRRRIAE